MTLTVHLYQYNQENHDSFLPGLDLFSAKVAGIVENYQHNITGAGWLNDNTSDMSNNDNKTEQPDRFSEKPSQITPIIFVIILNCKL